MKPSTEPLRTLATGALLTASLCMVPEPAARADMTMRPGGGPAAHHAPRGEPRYSHGVPFVSRTPGRRDGVVRRSHGVPFISREPSPAPGHARVYGEPGRHVLGAGCAPLVRRSYDRRGRLVIEHLSQCRDRFGRPYVLGAGHGRRR